MENKEFAEKLESRTLDFAIEIIKLSSKLPNTAEARVIKNQITNPDIAPNGDFHGQGISR